MEQSLQIGGVWSFNKAMSDRAERFSFHKMQQGRDFLQSCFPRPYQAIPGNDQVAYPTNQKAAGSKLKRTS